MLTQLLPNKPFYAIRVPVEAQYTKYGDFAIELAYGRRKIEVYEIGFKLEILGCCTTTEVDFDCSGILETKEWPRCKKLFRVYTTSVKSWTNVLEHSLRSLLTSKGIEPTNNEKVLIIKEIK